MSGPTVVDVSGLAALFGGGGGAGRHIAPLLAPSEDSSGRGVGNNFDINDLRTKLWNALLSDPDCLAFLGIGGAVGVLGLLDKIPIDVRDFGSSQPDAVTAYGKELGGNLIPKDPQISINSNGYFFTTGNTAMMGGTSVGTGTPTFQAVVMFHELGHATGALPRDGNSSGQSVDNDKTIMDKCKNAIANFAKSK